MASRDSRGCALLILMLAGVATAQAAILPRFHVASGDPGPWPRILSSLGFVPGQGGIYVVNDPSSDAATWRPRVEAGAIVILQGESAFGASLGIVPVAGRPIPVRSLTDRHSPRLSIAWERTLALPHFQLPAGAAVYTWDRATQIPLVAGLRVGSGAVLWLVVHPGDRGYERFPYLAQALADLGVTPPLRSRHLWAFFDWSYRSRVDIPYFARRWRQAGIGALHVAAWHFWEPDPARDKYLKELIDACHRQAITVHAWIEFPHVSERFWTDHPKWRERTALLLDAHLDWRKLMNLQNPESAAAVAAGLRQMLSRFDWDGVNLAELYFESLEGHANAARFTPMNDDVRREFRQTNGFDPHDLFDPVSARNHQKDAKALRTFLEFRAGLAKRMQEHWIGEIEAIRRTYTDLGLTLTHVDDRFDATMRDRIGADAARLLPLLDRHDFTFLVEDPATVWHLGPDRYGEIAARYQPITPRPAKLAVDINIVERYQDVYPTKQQTGLELFQLVHQAARAFPRVALYFENSIAPLDLPWLGSAAATPDRLEQSGDRLVVDSKKAIGVPWSGAAIVNGKLWPFTDGETVWLSAGAHVIQPSPRAPALNIVDFSATLRSLEALPDGLEMEYQSDGTAWVLLDRQPRLIQLDGAEAAIPARAVDGRWQLRLPRGHHLLTIRVASEGPSTSSPKIVSVTGTSL